ncbi:MAG: hypothetical protein SOY73_03945 [Blautia sp.]|nr:hypothetical protein [Blautia sp.]
MSSLVRMVSSARMLMCEEEEAAVREVMEDLKRRKEEIDEK